MNLQLDHPDNRSEGQKFRDNEWNRIESGWVMQQLMKKPTWTKKCSVCCHVVCNAKHITDPSKIVCIACQNKESVSYQVVPK